MAQFTNQAQLTYGDVVTNSNIAVGEILEALTISKTAIVDTYGQNDSVTYIINIVNSGVALNNLSVSDDLGTYRFGDTALVPLDYVEGSVKYFVNGALQSPPSVSSSGTVLVFSGIDIPTSSNVAIVYEATTNEYAPLGPDGSITNTVTASGSGITPIEASETITAINAPLLTITKSISPVPVSPNGVVTYTFVIENRGNVEITAEDNAQITDLFNPILSNINVTYNGVAWTEGENYTYDEATGQFATVPGQVVIGAASYVQDPTTGIWTLTPATSTLVVTGNIG
ncbi:MAG: hypothetical protein J6A54_02690 [Clostridia bacterium]|nr:hypothetical protein [Clostridia bacterium]